MTTTKTFFRILIPIFFAAFALCSDIDKGASLPANKLASSAIVDDVSQLPREFPADADPKYKFAERGELRAPPPLEFPEDSQRYKIVRGSSPKDVPVEFPETGGDVKVVRGSSPKDVPVEFPRAAGDVKVIKGSSPKDVPVEFPKTGGDVKVVKGSSPKDVPAEFPKTGGDVKVVKGSSPKDVPAEFPKAGAKVFKGPRPELALDEDRFEIADHRDRIMSSGRSLGDRPAGSARQARRDYPYIDYGEDKGYEPVWKPPKEFPTDTTKYYIIDLRAPQFREPQPPPPKEFPQGDEPVRMVRNETALKILMASHNFEMNNGTTNNTDKAEATIANDRSRSSQSRRYDHKTEGEKTERTDGGGGEDDDMLVVPLHARRTNPKLETEFVQPSMAEVAKDDNRTRAGVRRVVDLHVSVGKWLVVAVAATISLAAFVYALVLVFRKNVTRSQFKRHVLVNEDEFPTEFNKYSEF